MESYFITEKFTLTPKHLYKEEYLKDMFEVTDNEVIKVVELEKHNAVLAFVSEKGAAAAGAQPVVLALIKYAETLKDHNKIIINYSIGNKLTHIVAMEGEKLLLANTFHTADVKSVLYFIALVAGQVMFNPLLTKVHVYGEFGPEGIQLVEKYFAGIA